MGVFGMVGILRYCIFGFFSLSVLTAHAQRTVIVEPSQIKPTYTPGQGPFAFSDSRNWQATVSTQSGTRVNVPVNAVRSVGFPKFRTALTTAIKNNPGKLLSSAVITTALIGIDWVIDGSTIKSPNTYPASPSGTACYQYGDTCYASISSMCSRAMQDFPNSKNPTSEVIGGVGYCSFVQGTFGVSVTRQPTFLPSCPSGSVLTGGSCRDATIPYRVPTDTDWSQFASTISSPSDAAAIAPYIYDVPASYDYNPPDSFTFTGPPSVSLPSVITTSTDPSTGSTTVTESLPSLQIQYGTDPLSVTTTTTTTNNTFQDGTLTNTSTTTTTGTNPELSLEVPTDCEFMPTVCAFIEWYRQPFDEEEPDLSDIIADDEFSETYVFSGNAQCPPPANISTVFGDFEFSYQPACQWAGMIKPLIIMAALLSAIFINLGSVRGND